MLRLRLYDLRVSRLPMLLGLCAGDTVELAQYVNSAQRRLLQCKETMDEGWWGTWAEMVFNMQQSNPYITMPREVARMEVATICNRPVAVQNQFYDYLQFGNGRLPQLYLNTITNTSGQFTTIPSVCYCNDDVRSRNSYPTFTDLSNAPQNIVVYPGSASDVGKRVLLQGLDPSGNVIYSMDNLNRVIGQFVTLQSPFVTAPTPMSRITGIQKDITVAPVQIFQQDPTTAAQIQLSIMQPSEQTAWYRRYYFNNLPLNCCANDPGPNICNPTGSAAGNVVTITAIVKLDLIPVQADTDYCLIQNQEAIMEECQAIRYQSMDLPNAKAMALQHHKNAVQFLNGELAHYLGIDEPAVNFKPFGGAHLARQRIGGLI